MKTPGKLAVGIAMVGLVLAMRAQAQTMYYRTVSTQATSIVSLDNNGLLTWSNSIPGAVSAVESAPTLYPDLWSTYVDPILVTGSVATVRVPLGSPEPAVAQKYLFEVSYVNEAWGRVYKGLYVEHSGFVYCYGFVPPSIHVDPTTSPYSDAFLDAKTSTNRMYVGTEDRSQLNSMLALVQAAGRGDLSPPLSTANDMGIRQFKAFVFNPELTNYSVVLLHQDGDWTITNNAPEATTLRLWLSDWWHRAVNYGFP